jgi:hypothetical protein
LTIGFFRGSAPDWVNLRVSAAPAGLESSAQQGVHVSDVLVE